MGLDAVERHETHKSPMQIAHDPLFTAREKIELLRAMKAEVTGERANPDNLAYDPEEIDAAIAEIRVEVQEGTRPEASFGGLVRDRADD